jgi:hypothetical protein
MPIHINLLAESQIAEDLRRRDPVKRAIFGGAILVVLALVWSSSLQLAVMVQKNNLSQTQAEIDGHNTAFQEVLVSQKSIAEARNKLAALQKLSEARFLQGNLMNALQQLNTDGVQLTRVRLDQSYFTLLGTANTTNNDHVILGRPATTTEKIVMTLDARDSSDSPEDQINKFKDAVASQSYFKGVLDKTNAVQLTRLSSAQTDSSGRSYVTFTLESTFPDITR